MFILDDILAARAAGKLLPALVGAGMAVAIGFAAAETYEHKAPWGLAHRRDAAVARADAWRKSSDAWSAAALGWRSSFHAAETVRRIETRQAIAAVEAGAAQCSARVAEARRASLAIHALTTKEPAYDADHCPVRSMYDPDRLRDALGAH
jgi:hypothetical protein